MWCGNIVLLAIASCFIGACLGASTMALNNQQRFLGTLNRYYIMSWGQVVNNEGIQEIKNNEDDISQLAILDGTETVAIVVHGRESSAFTEFGHTMQNSFINKDRSMAVILVDWSIASHFDYQLASISVAYVAEDLSKFIVNMENQGKLDRSRLHLVGFDLGAHIAGHASRLARARKITALSPAGEGWGAFSQRLHSTDAQTVEVIHTDGVGSGAYGVGEPIGTLDFFANGGTGQPGCRDDDHLCFHNRAWQLFAASVDLNGHLIGRRCETMAQVQNDRCEGAYAILGTTELIKLQKSSCESWF